MTGPFETEREARELPAVRAVYDAFDAAPGVGKMAPHNYLMLVKACEGAGTDLGSASSYDRQILAWLSGWEPQICAVVAGLISRACEAGRVVAEDARRLDAIRGLLARFDWEHDDRQYALEAIERIVDGSQPGTVTFTADQAVVVVQALSDATEYRRRCASDWCSGCAGHPAGACDDHLDDLDWASKYAALLDELGERSEGRR